MDAGLVDRMSQTKRGKSIISYRTYCNLVENSPRITLPWERAGMFPKIVHVLLFPFRKVGIAREDSGERKCVCGLLMFSHLPGGPGKNNLRIYLVGINQRLLPGLTAWELTRHPKCLKGIHAP